MSNCGCNSAIFPYRVVQTLAERNAIPCSERMNGMIVTVVQASTTPDNTGYVQPAYTQYMLKGGDPCVNSNWKKLSVDAQTLSSSVGHVTEETLNSQVVDDTYLNNKYPTALEGFKVTVLPLNTTFMKVSNNRWAITNTKLNNDE